MRPVGASDGSGVRGGGLGKGNPFPASQPATIVDVYDDDDVYYYIRWQTPSREKVGFTKNTARRHRRVGGRAVTVTAMLHTQRYRKGKGKG